MQPYFETKDDSNPNVYIFQSENNLCSPHFHQCIEFVLCLSGQISVTINGNDYLLNAGDLGISMSFDIHSYYTPEKSDAIILLIPLILVPSLTKFMQKKSLEYNVLRSRKKTRLIKQAMYAMLNNTEANEFFLKGQSYIILAEVMKYIKLVDGGQGATLLMRNILLYIEDNFTKELTLDIISKKFGYSKFYMSHLFNSYINKNINEYINFLRVRLAAKLMAESNSNISEICYSVGFNSQRNFNRAFKKYYNKTPTEFRLGN